MKTQRRKVRGVTLLEVMLVLAIASSLLVLMLNYTTQKSNELRRDKAVLQMQQILNAAMSYYVNHSLWPITGATFSNPGCGVWDTVPGVLQPDYLPSKVTSPYSNEYFVACDAASNSFYVATTIGGTKDTATNAAIIAGKLPMAYRSTAIKNVPLNPCTKGDNCNVVVANVNVPGQNLNNARSVNFAAVYFSGSCVPAPSCPPNMSPSILVMPAAVTGTNDPPASGNTAYSINSFTAYATGGDINGSPIDPNSGPFRCELPNAYRNQACKKDMTGAILPSNGTLYWRVCLSVSTDKGLVVPSDEAQGKLMGSIVAITRCVPNKGNEDPIGSIGVWQQ